MKKSYYILLFMLTFSATIFATSIKSTYISTSKAVYTQEEQIIVNMKNMTGNENDWLGIFYAGADNTEENIIDWNWGEGKVNGKITFDSLEPGSYEVRAFFNNSLSPKASASFRVTQGGNNNDKATISINKISLKSGDDIVIEAKDMSIFNNQWIGIFKYGTANSWENVLKESWFNQLSNTTITFGSTSLDKGRYEARLFYNDNLKMITSTPFSITDNGNNHNDNNVKITTQKQTYKTGENIQLNLKNLSSPSETNNWVGIFKQGESSNWDNVLLEEWFDNENNINISFEQTLSAGTYEARLFYNDTISPVIKSVSFKIVEDDGGNGENNNLTLYEDAENGLHGWYQISGSVLPKIVSTGYNSPHCIKLTAEWDDTGKVNAAEYRLPLNNNQGQNILEMDIGGAGTSGGKPAGKFSNAPDGSMPHFSIGVIVNTLQGVRYIIWDSYLNHIGAQPMRTDYGNGYIELSFPSPVEHVRGFGFAPIDRWDHFKVNIQEALQILEPGNKIKSINELTVTGGFLDNIKLSSE